MNYLLLAIVAFLGIALGMYIARRNANAGFIAKQMEHPTSQGYEGQEKSRITM